jgi:Phosphodiester glycosidase
MAAMSPLALTDLFVLPALIALALCYRLRRRRGWADLLPLPTLLLALFAGYWVWYFHRPRPAPERRELAPGITYVREPRGEPRPVVVHVVEIDLTTPGLEFTVTPVQPTGDYDLPARTTSGFAREFDVRVAINASYFYPFRADSPFAYYPHAGDPVNATGSCVSRGRWYSSPEPGYALFAMTRDNRVAIDDRTVHVWNAVSGQPVLLQDGEIPDIDDTHPDPRTAVAVDRPGRRMIWVVVDGRQPGYSEGVTFRELAGLCREAGGWQALALDGGGSSTLVVREPGHAPRVLNCPIHGRHPPGVERPVANHLGVRVRPTPSR